MSQRTRCQSQAAQTLREEHPRGGLVRQEVNVSVTDPRLASVLRARNARGDAADIPDFRSAGIPVTAPDGHLTQFGQPIPTLEEPGGALAFVDARIAEGSDYIKIAYDDGSSLGLRHPATGQRFKMLSRATLKAVIEASHARGKLAIVHVSSQRHAREVVEAGADALAHLFLDEPPEPDFAAMLARAGVFVISTLSVIRASTGASTGNRLLEDARIAPYLDDASRHSLEASQPSHHTSAHCRFAEEELRQLVQSGVPLLAGTDAPLAGTAHGASLHAELALLVEAGMTPVQALTSATSATADAFQLPDRGRIAAGLLADLVLVAGDPAGDIDATRAIVGVWKQGMPVQRGVRVSYSDVITVSHQNMKTILISGASSGFGKLTAQTLARQGHTVLAGVRDSATRNAVVAAQLLEFAQRENASLRVVDLDVTDDESARCAVRTAIEQSGRLDVVVNNAGVMYTGPLEAFTPEQAREQFETNVIGVLRLIRAALPHMRTRREGLLIQISSVLGRIALPLSGLYSASKFALEGLSEAYWQELQEFGIDVVVVEPGSYPTAIWRRGVGPDDVERLEAYAQADGAQTHLAANRLAADAQDVASAIGRLIALPARTRPMRLVVADEPERRGADMLNTVSQQIHEAIRGPRTGELAGTHS